MAESKEKPISTVDPGQPIRFGSVRGIVVQREFGIPDFLRPLSNVGMLLPEPDGKFIVFRLNRFESEALAALIDVAAEAISHTHRSQSVVPEDVGEAGGVAVRAVAIDRSGPPSWFRIALAGRDEPRLDPTQAKALAALLRVAK